MAFFSVFMLSLLGLTLGWLPREEWRVNELPLRVPCHRGRLECGQANRSPGDQPVSKVIDGEDATPEAWPWMVKLFYYNDPRVICGGSVISDRLILTAAHCFRDRSRYGWKVFAGRYNYDRTQYEHGQQSAKVVQIFAHESFDYYWTAKNDIALLVIDPPLTFTSKVKPICLPSASLEVTEGQECMVAGWGLTASIPKTYPSTLQQVRLQVISDYTCSRYDWYPRRFARGQQICAGYAQGGKSPCVGDSGGPLVCKTGDRWFVQGIVSWGGDDSTSPCGLPKKPGVFTDVSKFTYWLQEKMRHIQHYYCNPFIVG